MKLISKMLVTLALFITFTSAQAAFIFGNDEFKFTGDTYIDTSGANTQGIGRVSTITQGSSVIWNSGDDGQFLNFTFGDFAPVVAPVAPIFNYVATGGYVNFYTTALAGLFNTSLDVATAMANIITGDLFLSTVAHGNTVGIGTPVTYSASGFLDVVAGPFAAQLDTNARPTFVPGDFADITFGLVGANNQNSLVNGDYEYIASADAQGSSVTIPEPGTLLLMGLGLIGFGMYGNKRNLQSFSMSA